MVDIKRGTAATYTQMVTDSDIVQFAESTGDKNPVHLDEDYAKTGPFGKRVAHGMLSAGFISTVLGTKLPGQGTIYLRQTLEFRRPVFIDDTITATVTVTRLNRKTKRIWLTTVCVNQNGKVVVQGKALVLFNALI